MSEMTWACHICKTERPDRFISVQTNDVKEDKSGVVIMQENIRFCNDNPDCRERAKTFSFYNIEK